MLQRTMGGRRGRNDFGAEESFSASITNDKFLQKKVRGRPGPCHSSCCSAPPFPPFSGRDWLMLAFDVIHAAGWLSPPRLIITSRCSPPPKQVDQPLAMD